MEEARLTGVGREFQRDGAAYAKQRLPNPSKRHLGTLRRFLFSDRSGLVGVYGDNNWEIYAGALWVWVCHGCLIHDTRRLFNEPDWRCVCVPSNKDTPKIHNFYKIKTGVCSRKLFIQENSFENVVCQSGGHFVQGFNEIKLSLHQNGRGSHWW